MADPMYEAAVEIREAINNLTEELKEVSETLKQIRDALQGNLTIVEPTQRGRERSSS
jgi:uncharacterized coiled-coil DUF342 family protein